jgi:hypothetical protein
MLFDGGFFIKMNAGLLEENSKRKQRDYCKSCDVIPHLYY